MTKLAGLFYTPRQISVMIEVDADDFEREILSECGAVFQAFAKGFYEADVELRKCITESALQGSSPAQAMLREIQKQGLIKG